MAVASWSELERFRRKESRRKRFLMLEINKLFTLYIISNHLTKSQYLPERLQEKGLLCLFTHYSDITILANYWTN